MGDTNTFLSDGFMKSKAVRISKWLFIAIAYGYLIWKLVTFDRYSDLATEWRLLSLDRMLWLIPGVLLMPINWFFESKKWQLLTAGFEKIKLKDSIKAVLAGICTGFFTPNRVGEPVGRILYLNEEHRKAGITMSIVSSLTQNLVMAIVGIPATLCYFYSTGNELQPAIENFILYTLVFLIGAGAFYFYLPKLSKLLSTSNISAFVANYTEALSAYTSKDLFQVIAVSLVRYLIFCSQFYFILHFFGIRLSINEAVVAIPTTYLFITFSPAFAFSEAVIRGSFAVLFIGTYSAHTINIALAGVFIWLINFIIPMAIGSYFVAGPQETTTTLSTDN